MIDAEIRIKAMSDRASNLAGAREEKAIEIARVLLQKGLPMDLILEATGLDLSVIEELQNEIKSH